MRVGKLGSFQMGQKEKEQKKKTVRQKDSAGWAESVPFLPFVCAFISILETNSY